MTIKPVTDHAHLAAWLGQEKADEIVNYHPPVSPGLDQWLGYPIRCLDHGFVRPINYMGDDSSVVQAARLSYGKGTRAVSEDKGLIHYLMRHRHTTPFEMAEIVWHCKLPIFVARQWIRHRTASVNEYSARYSILSKEFYVPADEDMAPQSKTNRQGRSVTSLTKAQAAQVRDLLINEATGAYEAYTGLLNDPGEPNEGLAAMYSQLNNKDEYPGLARELSRMALSLNFYTEWYWKCDLHNLLHFLSLRADPHAQKEIRVYAEAMIEVVKRWVPMTWDAFDDCVVKGARLTGKQLTFLRGMTPDLSQCNRPDGMSSREWQELMHHFAEN